MKRHGLLIGVYVVLMGALVVLQVAQLRTIEAAFRRDTAEAVGRAVAAAITEPSLERLLIADRATRDQVRSIIRGVTGSSDLVTSISIVDRSGRVVASDDLPAGRRLRSPESLLSPADTARFFLIGSDPLRGGRYVLAVPLRLHDDLVGYMRIVLESGSIAAVHRRALVELMLLSLAGVLLVVVVSSVLQSRLSRRIADLVRALDAARRGEASPAADAADDELAPALLAVEQVRRDVRDVRERARAGRRRLGMLAQAVDVGVVALDAGCGVEFANDRARTLLGCRDDAELDAAMRGLQQRLASVRDTMAPRQLTPATLDLEVEVDGSPRALRLDLYLVHDEPDAGLMVLVKDRAAFRALETNLRLATRLRVLSHFYRATAHEIRAPLQAMELNLHLLEHSLGADTADPELRAKRRRYLDVIGQELRRLLRMLESVLNQTRVSGDTVETFDLRELIDELAALIEAYCRQHKIELSRTVPAGPVLVDGSRDGIKQAILNIVVNALEAMPQEGRLCIELEDQDRELRLAVVDSGTGIAPELLERIFAMHTTTKENGSGIGLYVARSVVEAHGGRIRVESERGGGARFEIALPASTKALVS